MRCELHMLQPNIGRMPLHCPIQSRRRSGIKIPWSRAVMNPPPFAMLPMSLPESRESPPVQYVRLLGPIRYKCLALVSVWKRPPLSKAKWSNVQVSCPGQDGYCLGPESTRECEVIPQPRDAVNDMVLHPQRVI